MLISLFNIGHLRMTAHYIRLMRSSLRLTAVWRLLIGFDALAVGFVYWELGNWELGGGGGVLSLLRHILSYPLRVYPYTN